MRLTSPAAHRAATHRTATHRTAVDTRTRTAVQDSDGMAVASFVLGLLVLNIVLGPIAIVLAGTALRRGTTRRGRACLGLGLGIADLLVLSALMQMNDTISWSF
ncbi:DUF4190 domain-containing protein [Streptomyces hirsutus]|uniref:DUF4190 domain-containing protein n=1 Tax=Streptomyces hirsutus TaxID=35620 RepID=A0ABZ1GSE0_9ACTN|nr:DUF4190 domain-containing protein [Streptomyces hirsutus]WSD09067.1 DUF4190 domain-containing protein [Streptomyces hirsutus]WTD17482.1 DUF4190 domain-containing protein [Streptomyces hirsutus]